MEPIRLRNPSRRRRQIQQHRKSIQPADAARIANAKMGRHKRDKSLEKQRAAQVSGDRLHPDEERAPRGRVPERDGRGATGK
jgi:hypothetical protein